MIGSLGEIRSRFGIKEKLSHDGIRSFLRERLKSLHPDTNGGEFRNDTARREFEEVKQALEYLDHLNSGNDALVAAAPSSKSAVQVYLDAHKDMILADRQRQEAENRAGKARVDIKHRIKSDGILLKLASGTFSAVFGAILAFPSLLQGNPLISAVGRRVPESYVDIVIFSSFFILVMGLLVSGSLFIWRWMQEKRKILFVEEILSGTQLFDVCRYLTYQQNVKETGVVTLENLVSAVHCAGIDYRAPYASQIAEVVADQLIARAAATELTPGSISKRLKLSEAAMSELGISKNEDLGF